MRGKVTLSLPHLGQFRITPAYAGKSPNRHYRWCEIGDHPRLCGEKTFSAACQIVDLGSPPPMRGKVCKILGLDILYRITPAYAGKSSSDIGEIGESGDHPRLCGEKLYGEMVQIWDNRITPAYAGKSFLHPRRRRMRKDHPRLCGEKRKLSRLLIFSLGSPPPMRGKARHTVALLGK